MSILAHDPLTQLSFSVYENKGVFAVLLGSGLSRAAEIATGWEITLDLIRRAAAKNSLNYLSRILSGSPTGWLGRNLATLTAVK